MPPSRRCPRGILRSRRAGKACPPAGRHRLLRHGGKEYSASHRRSTMQVKEILRVKGNRLVSTEPSGSATDAVRTMAAENLGSLVVVEQGRMVGVLTFHELLRALASRSGTLGDLRVSEIMVRDPVTAT